MALLSKEQIWQAEDIQTLDVSVPEWGGDVRLRGLSGRERDEFEAKSLVQRGQDRQVNVRNLRARLIAACAINEDGTQLFQPSDLLHLGSKSAVALERLFDAARKLSGMSPTDIDELAENLDDAQSGDSPSA